jgi:hypothetical protein
LRDTTLKRVRAAARSRSDEAATAAISADANDGQLT